MLGLRRRGIESEILDLCWARRSAEDIGRFFGTRRFDLVGVTVRNLDDVWFAKRYVPDVAQIVQEIRRATDTPIVLGGSGFSIAPERILEACGADFGIVGEGEDSLARLADRLDDTARRSGIPGLVWRGDGAIRVNPMEPLDLSALRLSARGAIDHSAYTYSGGKKGGAGIQTKRGCDQACIYCVVPNIEGRQVRLRPPSDIVDEIENLHRSGVRRFFMCDSEFNLPESHAAAVCSEIVSRGLGERIVWQAYTSPPLSADLARLMKAAGCERILATIDHGSDRMLERLQKSFRTVDIEKSVAAARDASLAATYTLMLGGPGETMETIEETFGFISKLRPIQMALFDPPGIRIYPGTPIADIVREEGFSRRDPNLQGRIKGNEDFYEPVFYLSSGMGLLGRAVRLWRALGMARSRLSG